jgi:hypothetical protein
MNLIVELTEVSGKQRVSFQRKNNLNGAKITITFNSKLELEEMCQVFGEAEKLLNKNKYEKQQRVQGS